MKYLLSVALFALFFTSCRTGQGGASDHDKFSYNQIQSGVLQACFNTDEDMVLTDKQKTYGITKEKGPCTSKNLQSSCKNAVLVADEEDGWNFIEDLPGLLGKKVHYFSYSEDSTSSGGDSDSGDDSGGQSKPQNDELKAECIRHGGTFEWTP